MNLEAIKTTKQDEACIASFVILFARCTVYLKTFNMSVSHGISKNVTECGLVEFLDETLTGTTHRCTYLNPNSLLLDEW